jgi:membrane protease YdiL (CAAX protease family)
VPARRTRVGRAWFNADVEDKARFPWPFLGFVLLASVALGRGLADEVAPGFGRWRLAIALAPVFAAVLALFHPAVAPALRALGHRRVALVAAGLAVWTVSVPATKFDPYWVALVALWAATPILCLRLDPEPRRLTPLVLLVWLAWWLPLDLRWYGTIWTGPAGYEGCALLVTALAGVGFGAMCRPGAGPALRPPTPRDLGGALGVLLVFGLLAIPIGLGVGFLETHWPKETGRDALLRAFALTFTVALPEELYFRGVLDEGLRPHFRRGWQSLAVSSFAFGLMHWNNRRHLDEQVAYLLLASIAGVFYGLAYRRFGLWAAVICHMLVDLLWKAFL